MFHKFYFNYDINLIQVIWAFHPPVSFVNSLHDFHSITSVATHLVTANQILFLLLI